jgi:hypothetical protein
MRKLFYRPIWLKEALSAAKQLAADSHCWRIDGGALDLRYVLKTLFSAVTLPHACI